MFGQPIALMVRPRGRYPRGAPGGRGGRFRGYRRRFVWHERHRRWLEAVGFVAGTDLECAMIWFYQRQFLQHFKESIRCIGISNFVEPVKVDWFRYTPLERAVRE